MARYRHDKTFVHTSQKWTTVFKRFGSMQLPLSGKNDKEKQSCSKGNGGSK